MEKEQIIKNIEAALCDLYSHDIDLIINKTKEETISAHLMCYLKPYFENWSVDVEYNRDGKEVKKDKENKIIHPDIIIHHRTPDRDKKYSLKNNLVAIEIKGYWNTEDGGRERDKEKLEDIKSEYGYQYIFCIELEKNAGQLIDINN